MNKFDKVFLRVSWALGGKAAPTVGLLIIGVILVPIILLIIGVLTGDVTGVFEETFDLRKIGTSPIFNY
ncbi:MAG: hypothetical protein J7K90_02810 [Desulfuromusa sp.]|nr:hypothetical protein [Desulfuromusa sp.]